LLAPAAHGFDLMKAHHLALAAPVLEADNGVVCVGLSARLAKVDPVPRYLANVILEFVILADFVGVDAVDQSDRKSVV
jgi:hypothetical protein